MLKPCKYMGSSNLNSWLYLRAPSPPPHGGPVGKESFCSAGDVGSIPGLGRSPGEGKGYPFQYSGLENSMHCIVHGVGHDRVTFTSIVTSMLQSSSYSHLIDKEIKTQKINVPKVRQ